MRLHFAFLFFFQSFCWGGLWWWKDGMFRRPLSDVYINQSGAFFNSRYFCWVFLWDFETISILQVTPAHSFWLLSSVQPNNLLIPFIQKNETFPYSFLHNSILNFFKIHFCSFRKRCMYWKTRRWWDCFHFWNWSFQTFNYKCVP